MAVSWGGRISLKLELLPLQGHCYIQGLSRHNSDQPQPLLKQGFGFGSWLQALLDLGLYVPLWHIKPA